MEKKVMMYAEYGEVEQIIKEEFGHIFEIPCDLESSNDVSHEFTVSADPIKYSGDQEDLDKFIATGKGSWLTSSLLDELCRRGKIEAGEYIIRVSW